MKIYIKTKKKKKQIKEENKIVFMDILYQFYQSKTKKKQKKKERMKIFKNKINDLKQLRY